MKARFNDNNCMKPSEIAPEYKKYLKYFELFTRISTDTKYKSIELLAFNRFRINIRLFHHGEIF